MSEEETLEEEIARKQKVVAEWYAKREFSLDNAAGYEDMARETGVLHANAWAIVGPCRDRYLEAARLAGVQGEFAERLETLEHFPHKAIIGVQLRLRLEFERELHASQLDFDWEGDSDGRLVLLEKWRVWYHARVEELSQEPWFYDATVTTVVLPYKDPRSIEAAEMLYERLGAQV